jgi:hypothetical protein
MKRSLCGSASLTIAYDQQPLIAKLYTTAAEMVCWGGGAVYRLGEYMIRIGVALALFFAVSVPVIAAERWVFDNAAKAAGVNSAAASIIITCADGGLGLLYVVNRSALPSDKRSKRKAVLAFSDFSVSHRSTVELPLKTNLFHMTEFSAAGSGAAIRAAVTACKER